MGCQSSLLSAEERPSLMLNHRSSIEYNMNFSDFVKGNIGTVYEEYHFTGWIYRSSNLIVRWAIHKRSEDRRVVKIIKRTIKSQRRTMNQINILKKLDNPSIVKLNQYFIDNEFIYLIFQSIQGRHVYDQIIGVEEYVLRNIQKIIKQILMGIAYCHSHGIAHCNLHPSNILVVRVKSDIFVKIVGFGDAIDINEYKNIENAINEEDIESNQVKKLLKIQKKISKTYRSPEENELKSLEKQDIWSVGIIMENLLSKIFGSEDFLSFQNEKINEIIIKKSDNIPQSKKSLDLLRKMLEKDPEKRLSAFQCLKHEYFELVMKTSPWKITIIYRSLHNFKINQKLKAFLSMYLTFKQTNIQEQNQFITEFYNLDKNKDGRLQYEQLLQGLKNYYFINEKEASSYVNQIFESLDKNRNMCIEYSEFLLGTVNISKVIERKSIENLFDELDKNGDGYIDEKEFQEVFGLLKLKNVCTQKKINLAQFEAVLMNLTELKRN